MDSENPNGLRVLDSKFGNGHTLLATMVGKLTARVEEVERSLVGSLPWSLPDSVWNVDAAPFVPHTHR